MSRAKKHVEEEHENHERWLVSYADMMTLLMVLFIVLFAIGQTDQHKFDQLSEGLVSSFGQAKVLDGADGILEGSTKQAVQPDQTLSAQEALEREQQAAAARRLEVQNMAKARAAIEKALAAQHLTGAVEFRQESRGLVIDIVTDRVLFDLGSTTLRPDGQRVLDAVAPALTRLPNRLAVEGHTDNVPVSGRYPSNWELSAERATTVLRHLLTRHVRSSMVSAAGYADQRPLAANDTTAHRARNRRVAIVVLAGAPTATGVAGPTTTTAASPLDVTPDLGHEAGPATDTTPTTATGGHE